jgi:hypothetical protein
MDCYHRLGILKKEIGSLREFAGTDPSPRSNQVETWTVRTGAFSSSLFL